MSRQKFDRELNTLRGKRLKECRLLRDFTQDQFAEMVDNSVNYISMLENGKRLIDWNKAIEYAKILNVNPSYIMCKSDILQQGRKQETLDNEEFGNLDATFLQFLLLFGHTITFQVVKLYDHEDIARRVLQNKPPFQIEATLYQLREFSLSDYHCKLQKDETLSEVVIVGVLLDGVELSYGGFVFMIDHLYDYIGFTIDSIEHFKNEYNKTECLNLANREIMENLISNSHGAKLSEILNIHFDDIIHESETSEKIKDKDNPE